MENSFMLDGKLLDHEKETSTFVPPHLLRVIEDRKLKMSKLLDYKYCDECNINSVLNCDGKLFCISCEKYTFVDGKETKTNSSCYVGNKFIHFKNVIKRLLTRSDNSDLVEELKVELKEMDIDIKDVDSNFISKRLKNKKIYTSKDYKKVFEILSDLNNHHIEDMSEEMFEQITSIFHSLVLFVQTIRSGKSINYNFFLNKIFMSVNAISYLHPQMVKNPYRNNENQLIWDMFIKYNNEEQLKKKEDRTIIIIPERSEITFNYDFECSLNV
ncbi:late transcription factor VLTF3-like protein [Salmon gill poxvirus]|uniref:Late transcription factor VLTF3-like protein n=1 Tax=Salmon gill poxvirus TaxID=1680908 RepID=A0A0H4YFK3_9POXV|nr:late transcription factor VLTF3-like protein [Salmon gill poxvirus]AKR04224.1 late transcription factor VLTF3-like protein [Salmon gill poxvirus]WMX26510.1 late transcription factor VLTF3-like protein [Salmon gill poxvirus]